MNKNLDRVLTFEAEAENEWVAGVDRDVLFGGKYWTGLEKINETEMFNLLIKNLKFMPRTEELERDESFKQVIPYFLVRNGGKYLTSVRKSRGGDVRLHNARLIGFGGHLRKGDIKGTMKDWLKREFEEEIKTSGVTTINFLGVVNDDNDVNIVSKMHFGLVFVVDVADDAKIIEEDKFEKGIFLSVGELNAKSQEMESWSALVLRNL